MPARGLRVRDANATPIHAETTSTGKARGTPKPSVVARLALKPTCDGTEVKKPVAPGKRSRTWDRVDKRDRKGRKRFQACVCGKCDRDVHAKDGLRPYAPHTDRRARLYNKLGITYDPDEQHKRSYDSLMASNYARVHRGHFEDGQLSPCANSKAGEAPRMRLSARKLSEPRETMLHSDARVAAEIDGSAGQQQLTRAAAQLLKHKDPVQRPSGSARSASSVAGAVATCQGHSRAVAASGRDQVPAKARATGRGEMAPKTAQAHEHQVAQLMRYIKLLERECASKDETSARLQQRLSVAGARIRALETEARKRTERYEKDLRKARREIGKLRAALADVRQELTKTKAGTCSEYLGLTPDLIKGSKLLRK